jgi:site-specific recombinase XerD
MNRYNKTPKVGAPALQSTRLLDQLRERIRYLHYSLQTEKAYVYWARLFVRWHGRNGEMRHPRTMGQAEVEAFLTMLAVERQVSPATHRQALNAILFLYKEVLGQDLPWLQSIGRPPERKRIPVVLTVTEVQSVLALMAGTEGILARLLYGTGMRLAEGLNLRVKDLDFDRHAIVVRSGKGDKDRVVMLPHSLIHSLRERFLRRPRWLLQAGTDIRTVQELLGHSDMSTTMIYTHVLKVAAGGTASPLDALCAAQLV